MEGKINKSRGNKLDALRKKENFSLDFAQMDGCTLRHIKDDEVDNLYEFIYTKKGSKYKSDDEIPESEREEILEERYLIDSSTRKAADVQSKIFASSIDEVEGSSFEFIRHYVYTDFACDLDSYGNYWHRYDKDDFFYYFNKRYKKIQGSQKLDTLVMTWMGKFYRYMAATCGISSITCYKMLKPAKLIRYYDIILKANDPLFYDNIKSKRQRVRYEKYKGKYLIEQVLLVLEAEGLNSSLTKLQDIGYIKLYLNIISSGISIVG